MWRTKDMLFVFRESIYNTNMERVGLLDHSFHLKTNVSTEWHAVQHILLPEDDDTVKYLRFGVYGHGETFMCSQRPEVEYDEDTWEWRVAYVRLIRVLRIFGRTVDDIPFEMFIIATCVCAVMIICAVVCTANRTKARRALISLAIVLYVWSCTRPHYVFYVLRGTAMCADWAAFVVYHVIAHALAAPIFAIECCLWVLPHMPMYIAVVMRIALCVFFSMVLLAIACSRALLFWELWIWTAYRRRKVRMLETTATIHRDLECMPSELCAVIATHEAAPDRRSWSCLWECGPSMRTPRLGRLGALMFRLRILRLAAVCRERGFCEFMLRTCICGAAELWQAIVRSPNVR
jgi:hypothetical protein